MRAARESVERGAARVSLLVPAYNEAATIRVLLERVEALPLDKEIVVVDDGSTDATPAILAEWLTGHPDTVVVTQPHRGKGAAVRAAIGHASGEICVIQDADLEYDPDDVPALIEPIERAVADVVFGSRMADGAAPRGFAFGHMAGNRALSLLASALYGKRMSDIETGFKAFRTATLRSLPLHEDGFGIEAEIAAQVCLRNLRICERPISYRSRGYADGKKLTWRDGFRTVQVLVAQRVRAGL